MPDNVFSMQIEKTPSPSTLVFRFQGLEPFVDQPIEYQNVAETDSSPLAAKVFGFPWTQSVLLGQDFLSITKQDWVDWQVLTNSLADLLTQHLRQGLPVYEAIELAENPTDSNEASSSDSDLVLEIKKAIRREIRPIVSLDGGDVHFAGFSAGKLSVQFKGSCAGCPSKSVTLKEGIEVRMKELFPEITEVVGV
jgi:Fe-S cluster biogenesis protein NfuA